MPVTSQLYYFSQDTITRYAPRSPGVYALYDQAQSLIYYGMSETSIEARLQSHLDGYDGRCTQGAYACNWELSAYPAARERELLAEYKRTYGVLPRCNSLMT